MRFKKYESTKFEVSYNQAKQNCWRFMHSVEKIHFRLRSFQCKWIVFLLPILFAFGQAPTFGTELNVTVSVTSPGLAESDRIVLNTLQTQLEEFVNDRDWTPYTFQPVERIEGSIILTVLERQGDEFRGSIQVQSRRPVFHTSYFSPVFNHLDREVSFRYTAGQSLEYADNVFTSNLTSLVAFYVYIIIGLDFDTFSPLGGTEFFQRAQNIVNQAQNAVEPGWRSFESRRNRYWIVENLLNTELRPIRQAIYAYHRLGFDRLTGSIQTGRDEVLKALEQMRMVNRERPGSFIVSLIMDVKSDEIINLFLPASSVERERILGILSELDPANNSRHQALRR